MKGRKPKPSNLKIIQGTARKDRMNKREPNVKTKIPNFPNGLPKEAKVEWDRISKELFDLGVLTEIDRAPLVAYCVVWARWIAAERKIKKEGLVVSVTDSQGQKQKRQNPYLKIADSNLAILKTFAVEFGLTPSSRTRVEVKNNENEPNPFSKF
jgi:P27 family predicted phage terminase small subunit